MRWPAGETVLEHEHQTHRDFPARSYPPPAKAWFVVAVLLLIGIVSYLDRYIVAVLVEPIKADLGLSDTQVSLLQSTSYAVFFVAFSMPAGVLVDRVNRSALLAASIVLWSLATALGGLASSFWGIFVSRAIVGISEACLAPAAFSLIADHFPPEKRGKPMSAYNMANYLGGGASMLIGGLVFGALGNASLDLPVVGMRQPWQATFRQSVRDPRPRHTRHSGCTWQFSQFRFSSFYQPPHSIAIRSVQIVWPFPQIRQMVARW